jgi:hypothetical protein
VCVAAGGSDLVAESSQERRVVADDIVAVPRESLDVRRTQAPGIDAPVEPITVHAEFFG